MDTKHTPGDWEYDGDRYVRAAATGGTICRVCEDDGHCDTPGSMPKEANGSFIAAAPKMLLQLRVVLARLDLELPGAVFPCSAMREDIRAAIAAATE